MPTIEKYLSARHPFTRDRGYENLLVIADSADELAGLLVAAEKKFWVRWNSMPGITHSALLYKPSGVTEPWVDHALPEMDDSSRTFHDTGVYRREMLCTLYIFCEDCGGKIGEVEARPDEIHDRSRPCASLRGPSKKCKYD